MFPSCIPRKTSQTSILLSRQHSRATRMPRLNRCSSFRLPVALLVAACVFSMLAGCAATHVAIAKRNLEVSTRMSDAVFLDPVGGDKRTAFIYVRNTSDRPNFDIETPLKSAIAGARVSDRERPGRGPLQAAGASFERLQDEHYRG